MEILKAHLWWTHSFLAEEHILCTLTVIVHQCSMFVSGREEIFTTTIVSWQCWHCLLFRPVRDGSRKWNYDNQHFLYQLYLVQDSARLHGFNISRWRSNTMVQNWTSNLLHCLFRCLPFLLCQHLRGLDHRHLQRAWRGRVGGWYWQESEVLHQLCNSSQTSAVVCSWWNIWCQVSHMETGHVSPIWKLCSLVDHPQHLLSHAQVSRCSSLLCWHPQLSQSSLHNFVYHRSNSQSIRLRS